MDVLRGRRGKYKTATVFLVPVTDTPTMTPFSLMDCHIIPQVSLSYSAAKKSPTLIPHLQSKVGIS